MRRAITRPVIVTLLRLCLIFKIKWLDKTRLPLTVSVALYCAALNGTTKMEKAQKLTEDTSWKVIVVNPAATVANNDLATKGTLLLRIKWPCIVSLSYFQEARVFADRCRLFNLNPPLPATWYGYKKILRPIYKNRNEGFH